MNNKQKIMEVLLNTPNNLSKDQIMWAASNLPDDNENGQHGSPVVYNHEMEDVFEALGTTEEAAKKIADILSSVTKSFMTEDNYKVSHAVEEVVNKTKDNPQAYPTVVSILLRHVAKSIQEEQMPSFIMKMLSDAAKAARRKRKDEDEE